MRPEELVRGAGQEIAAPGLHVDGPVRSVVDRVEEDQRPGVVGQPLMRCTSLIVPTALEAQPPPRSRVRGRSCGAGRPGRGCSLPGECRRSGPSAPASRAASTQRLHVGVVVQARNQHLVAGPQRAADERLSARSGCVMFWPKTISSGEGALSKSATAW